MNYYIIEKGDSLIVMKVADHLNEIFLQKNTEKVIAHAKSISEVLDVFSKQSGYQEELLEALPIRFGTDNT